MVMIDEEARGMARLAQSQINAHEAACEQRWRQARDATNELKQEVRRMYDTRWSLAMSVMVGLLTVCGGLITYIWLTRTIG